MENKNKFGSLQFLKNILSNGGIFVINTVISFWYTPYLIQSLGTELFSFIPLTTSIVNYFGIITLSLNASTSRYLMIELEREEEDKSNQIFNTSLVGIITMILVAIPIGGLLVFNISNFFNVPIENKIDIQYLLIASLIAFFLTTISSAFSIASFSQNRFDLKKSLSFLGRLGQVGIVLILFSIDEPNLIYAGIGSIVLSLITLIGDIFLWKKLLPILKINIGLFNKNIFKDMLNTNFWMLINRIGFLIFMNIEMIIANLYLPLALAGIYGALLLIPNNLKTISYAVSTVWGPLIISKYSQHDYAGISKVAKSSIKTIGLAVALPIGFISGVAELFLSFWLGPEFVAYKWIVIVMAFNVLLNSLSTPLNNIFNSMNKVKIPAIFTGLTAIIYFIVSVVAVKRFGAIGLAVSGGIILSIRNVFFIPIYCARLLKKKWWIYMVSLISAPIIAIIVAIISNGIVQLFDVHNILELLFVGVGISILYLIFVYLIGLSKNEKEVVLKYINKSNIKRFN